MGDDEYEVRFKKDGSQLLSIPLDLLQAAAVAVINQAGLVDVAVPSDRMSAVMASIERFGGRERAHAVAASNDGFGDDAGVAGGAMPAAPVPAAYRATATSSAEPKFMRKKDFAFRHSVSISTINYWLRCGLPTNGITGRGIRVNVREGDAWVEAGGPALAGAGRR